MFSKAIQNLKKQAKIEITTIGEEEIDMLLQLALKFISNYFEIYDEPILQVVMDILTDTGQLEI